MCENLLIIKIDNYYPGRRGLLFFWDGHGKMEKLIECGSLVSFCLLGLKLGRLSYESSFVRSGFESRNPERIAKISQFSCE